MTSGALHLMDHPLIQHKITMLRKKETCTKDFRQLVNEIALLIGYEATRDLNLETIEIETPLQKTIGKIIPKQVCLVPILRAGLGMVDAMLELLPAARVGHVGMYRDHETLQPVEYYFKMPPDDVEDRVVIVLDPMLATGGSASATITALKKRGFNKIKIINLIGAPEGVATIRHDHPDVDMYLGCLDECLNENGYILPGVGDAGDRLFGTI